MNCKGHWIPTHTQFKWKFNCQGFDMKDGKIFKGGHVGKTCKCSSMLYTEWAKTKHISICSCMHGDTVTEILLPSLRFTFISLECMNFLVYVAFVHLSVLKILTWSDLFSKHLQDK